MFRSIVFRGLSYRAGTTSGSFRGSSKRYASSSNRNTTGGNFGAISFGALVTLGAILFILPSNVKVFLPKAQKPEQVKTELKSNSNPKEELPKSQAPSEHNQAESTKDERSTAYNPDTGEINWDCPCLGGMAHGPCGEEFKAAFACFVYSEAEPKGIDCVTKFQQMQDCFREHPEHYAEQLRDEDEAAAGEPVESEVVEVDVEVPERQEAETSTGSASSEPTFAESLSAEPVTEPIEDAEPTLVGISEPSQEPIVEETEVVVVDVPEEETK